MPYSFTFGTQQFLNQSTDDALAILHLQHRNHLFRLIDNRNYHLELLKIRTEFPVVSRISNIAGLTSFPPITMWDEPERVLFLSLDAIKKYQIKLSYIFLQIAQEQLAKAQNILYEYAGKNDAGAGHAIWFFTQVKSASITTVGAVSTAITKNQLAGSAIGTGYGSLLEVIEQGMEVHYGTRDRVDWVGISSEAAWKLVFA
jgi:hypothetical protein